MKNDQPTRRAASRSLGHYGKLALCSALASLLAACGGGSDAQTGVPTATARTLAMTAAAATPEVALSPLGAVATSSERGDLSAAAAIDQNAQTRWSSGFTDEQSLTIDYGSSRAINRVRINWENAHASAYLLQTSEDGATWTTIKSVSGSNGGIEDWTGLSGQGRFLRIQGVTRGTAYGYSLYELGVYA